MPANFKNPAMAIGLEKISFHFYLKGNAKACSKIMASGPITSWEIDEERVETVAEFIFGAPESLQMVIAATKLKDAYSLEGKL